jgi:hypothetical protein
MFSIISFSQTIEVDKLVFDFGNINFGDSAICYFNIKNVGKSPLLISKCQPSVSWVKVSCPLYPIKTNESYPLKVTYDSKREGYINKSISIHSNDMAIPVLVLRIRGNVRKSE